MAPIAPVASPEVLSSLPTGAREVEEAEGTAPSACGGGSLDIDVEVCYATAENREERRTPPASLPRVTFLPGWDRVRSFGRLQASSGRLQEGRFRREAGRGVEESEAFCAPPPPHRPFP